MPNKDIKYKESKKRLDQLLVDRAFFSSKTRAQTEIMLGNVIVGNTKITKPGKRFDEGAEIRVIDKSIPYVSRGALKLKGALEDFSFDTKGLTCCDLGASTGGFTEILLTYGAKMIYAVDVGYGQLHWKLREDSRVVVMERTNARLLTKEMFENEIEFFSGDLSFISLKNIIPVVKELLKKDRFGIFLIKPQFELDASKNVKGIVKKIEYRKEAILSVIDCFIQHNFSIIDLSYSHIKGPKGNVEFTLLVKNDGKKNNFVTEDKINFILNKLT